MLRRLVGHNGLSGCPSGIQVFTSCYEINCQLLRSIFLSVRNSGLIRIQISTFNPTIRRLLSGRQSMFGRSLLRRLLAVGVVGLDGMIVPVVDLNGVLGVVRHRYVG